MDSSKMLIAHIATEVVVIGGVSFFLNKRISDLTAKVSELEKKLEKLEGCSSSNGGIPEEEFNKFQQQTTNHLKNIYAIINGISNDIAQNQNVSQQQVPPPQSRQFVNRGEREDKREEMKRNSRIQVSSESQNTGNTGNTSNTGNTGKKTVQFQESLSLTPEPHHNKINIEVIDDDHKEIPEEQLNDELEEELRALSDDTNGVTSIIELNGSDENNLDNLRSLKNDDTNTSQETPLEFLPTKGKKSKKKL